MKIRNLFLAFLSLTTLFSCNRTPKGTILVERSLSHDYIDISIDEMKEKCENNLQFVVFVNSENCHACYQIKSTFLDNFVKENNFKIYSLIVDDIENSELSFIKDISLKNDYYRVNEEGMFIIYYPLILIIKDGKVNKFALGTDKINSKFFKSNLYYDEKSSNFDAKEDQILSLNKTNAPKFISYSEQIDKGVIYHTNQEKSDEITYYISPLKYEFEIDIYLDVNENNLTPSLEIINQDFKISTSNRSDYFNLISSYLRVN